MDAQFFMNWTGQVRKGLWELTILNDIGNRGTYAYEIEKTLCKTHGLLMGTGVIYRCSGGWRDSDWSSRRKGSRRRDRNASTIN